MAQRPDDGSRIRWSEGGAFAIIPEWLLDEAISDRAVRLFAILTRYANNELRAMPARKLLRARLGCAMSTLDTALAELIDVGAVSAVARYRSDGGRSASDYLLHHIRRPPGSQDTLPDQSGTPLPEDSDRKELEEVLERESNELAIARPLPAVPAGPPKIMIGPAPRENRPLNVLMEECGVDPGNDQRVRWATTALYGDAKAQGIVELFWLEIVRWFAGHPERANLIETASDREHFTTSLCDAIRKKARLYRDQMDGARLTPTALRNWWLDIEKSRTDLTASDVGRMSDEQAAQL